MFTVWFFFIITVIGGVFAVMNINSLLVKAISIVTILINGGFLILSAFLSAFFNAYALMALAEFATLICAAFICWKHLFEEGII